MKRTYSNTTYCFRSVFSISWKGDMKNWGSRLLVDNLSFHLYQIGTICLTISRKEQLHETVTIKFCVVCDRQFQYANLSTSATVIVFNALFVCRNRACMHCTNMEILALRWEMNWYHQWNFYNTSLPWGAVHFWLVKSVPMVPYNFNTLIIFYMSHKTIRNLTQ